MTNFYRDILNWLLLSIVLLAHSGCGGGGSSGTANPAGGGSAGSPLPNISQVVIQPGNFSLPKGLSSNLSVDVISTDGTRVTLTNGVVWSVAERSVASVTPQGVVTGLKSGETLITATVAGVSGSTRITVTDALLRELRLDPSSNQSLPKGAQLSIRAIATYSDNSEFDVTEQANWVSSAATVASVSKGVVDTKTEGTAEITASLENKQASLSVSVTSAELVGLEIQADLATLPQGYGETLRAYGRYTDNTLLELSSVQWSSSNTDIAIVNSLGRVKSTGFSTGQVDILASYGGKVGRFTLTVTSVRLEELYFSQARLDIYSGLKDELQLFGRFSDGSMLPMGDQVSWSSLNASIASVSTAGVVTGEKAGDIRIRALGSNGVAREIWVKVSAATLDKIQLTVPKDPLPIGARVKIEAIGFYSDGTSRPETTSLQWIPSDGSLGTFEGSSGYLDTNGTGTLTIRVVGGPPTRRVEATATIQLGSSKLEEVMVSPGNLEIPVGEMQQFQAFGRFSDGRIFDVGHKVTWSYSGSSISSIGNSTSSRGLFTAGTVPGAGTVTASHSDGFLVPVSINVVDTAAVTNVSISPSSLALPRGNTYSRLLTATVTYSNGFQTQATSGSYLGTSGSSSIISVFSSSGYGGIVTRNVGSAGISFTYKGVTDTIPVVVSEAALESMEVSPTNLTLPIGLTSHLICTGYFSDDQHREINDSVQWSSSKLRVLTVEPGGKLNALEDGVATVTAFDPTTGLSASVDVTVVSKALDHLRFDEGPSYLRVGTDRRFKVEGVYRDGSVYDLTDSVVWTSSDPGVAQISNQDTNRGQIVASSLGRATITAREPNFGQEVELPIELASSVKLSETFFPIDIQEIQNSPDGERLYVLTETELNVYRASDMQLLHKFENSGGVGMDVSADGRTVLVAQYSQSQLASVDTVNFTEATIPLPTGWKVRDVTFGNNGFAYLLVEGKHPASINLSTFETKVATGGTGLSYARYLYFDELTSKVITGDYRVSASYVNRYSADGPDLVWEASQSGGSNGYNLTLHPQGGKFVFCTATGNDIPGYSSYYIVLQSILEMDKPISQMSLGAYPRDSAFSTTGSVLYAINSGPYDEVVHLYCPETGRDLGRILPELSYAAVEFQKVEVSLDGSRLYLYVTDDYNPSSTGGSISMYQLRP